jgi:FAD/FMN-containing dehydrogenase
LARIAPSTRERVRLRVTFLAKIARGDEIAQAKTLRRAAVECIAANGGALLDQPNAVNDALGLDALRAIKRTLDPDDVMNPGEWLGAQPSSVDAAIEYQERFWNLPK